MSLRPFAPVLFLLISGASAHATQHGPGAPPPASPATDLDPDASPSPPGAEGEFSIWDGVLKSRTAWAVGLGVLAHGALVLPAAALIAAGTTIQPHDYVAWFLWTSLGFVAATTAAQVGGLLVLDPWVALFVAAGTALTAGPPLVLGGVLLYGFGISTWRKFDAPIPFPFIITGVEVGGFMLVALALAAPGIALLQSSLVAFAADVYLRIE